MVELSVDEVMVIKVVGVGVADSEESDEDTSLLVDIGLSVDERDKSVLDASLVVGEALLSVDDVELVAPSLLVGAGLPVDDGDADKDASVGMEEVPSVEDGWVVDELLLSVVDGEADKDASVGVEEVLSVKDGWVVDTPLLVEVADEGLPVSDVLVNESVEEALTDEGVEAGDGTPVEEELIEDSSVLLVLALSIEENSEVDALTEEASGAGVADDELDDSLLELAVFSDEKELVDEKLDPVVDAIEVESNARLAEAVDEMSDIDASLLVVLVTLSLEEVSAVEMLTEEDSGVGVVNTVADPVKDDSVLEDIALSVEDTSAEYVLVAGVVNVESAEDRLVVGVESTVVLLLGESAREELAVGVESAVAVLLEESIEEALDVGAKSAVAVLLGDSDREELAVGAKFAVAVLLSVKEELVVGAKSAVEMLLSVKEELAVGVESAVVVLLGESAREELVVGAKFAVEMLLEESIEDNVVSEALGVIEVSPAEVAVE